MAIGRSPNYPRIELGEAIEKIKEVYEKQHTYPTSKEVLSKNLGYGGINGGSQSMIGALTAYGLIIKVGNDLKVSDEAVSILELPEDSLVRVETLKLLATTPDIFAELERAYPDKLPQNELIRHFLIKKKYLPKAADEVIRTYRANLEFVNALNGKYNINHNNSDQGAQGSMQNSASSQQSADDIKNQYPINNNQVVSSNIVQQNLDESALIFKISRNSEAKVIFSGQVTQEAIRKLKALLELSEDTFPTQNELEEKNKTQSREAIWKNKDHDQPVNLTGEKEAYEGKIYHSIENSKTRIPEDELDFGS